MKKALAVSAVASAMVFAGCASMTTIQTAETLPPGKSTYYVAWVPTTVPLLDTNSDGKADQMMFQTVEAGMRLGITDRFDMGAKLFPIGLQFDGKYQFYKENAFKSAADLGFGWMTVTSGNFKSTLIDIIPAVPVTYRPFSWCALTLTPKMLARIATSSNDSTNTSSTSTYFLGGGTGSVKFTVKNLGSMIFEYGKFAGKYQTDHFALAVEKPLHLWGKDTGEEDNNQ